MPRCGAPPQSCAAPRPSVVSQLGSAPTPSALGAGALGAGALGAGALGAVAEDTERSGCSGSGGVTPPESERPDNGKLCVRLG